MGISNRAALAVSAALMSFAAGALAAPVVNGNFEPGNLNGWTVSNRVALAERGSLYEPLQGSSSAVIVNFSEQDFAYGSCQADPWNSSCPPPLPYVPNGGPSLTYTSFTQAGFPPAGMQNMFFRGSYIGQDIQVNAGDVLNWDWQMDGRDSGIDFGRFVALNGGVYSYSDVIQTGNYYGGGNFRVQNTYTFAATGLYTIYFGTVQNEDSTVSSALTLDNIRLRNVPEPATLALVCAAMAGAVTTRRRRAVAPTA